MLFTSVLCHFISHPHKQKSSIPIKLPFPYRPMIFTPHTYYLVLVRAVKNKKIQVKFSCIAIFLYMNKGARLTWYCTSQILNFVICSDWLEVLPARDNFD